MGETLEETEAKHWVPLVHGEMAGDGRSTADREMAAEANGGGGAPVRIGQGEVVGELRGLTAELARVSARAVELRSYGFHCGQAAAELGLRRQGGSGGNWSTGSSRKGARG